MPNETSNSINHELTGAQQAAQALYDDIAWICVSGDRRSIPDNMGCSLDEKGTAEIVAQLAVNQQMYVRLLNVNGVQCYEIERIMPSLELEAGNLRRTIQRYPLAPESYSTTIKRYGYIMGAFPVNGSRFIQWRDADVVETSFSDEPLSAKDFQSLTSEINQVRRELFSNQQHETPRRKSQRVRSASGLRGLLKLRR